MFVTSYPQAVTSIQNNENVNIPIKKIRTCFFETPNKHDNSCSLKSYINGARK